MKHIVTTRQFAIYDDAFSPLRHRAMWERFQLEEYDPVPLARGVHRIDDGQALRCTKSYIWTGDGQASLPPRDRWKSRVVPATAEDYASELTDIAGLGAEHTGLLGTQGKDWVAILLTPHLYRRGDALSWHTDGFSYTGAFVYYVHQHWNCLWGGEMLIVDERTSRDPRHFSRKHLLDNEEENARLASPGLGTFVFPNPNRLVLIGAGNEHKVTKIHDAAGNNVRAGLAGFFLRADAVDLINLSQP